MLIRCGFLYQKVFSHVHDGNACKVCGAHLTGLSRQTNSAKPLWLDGKERRKSSENQFPSTSSRMTSSSAGRMLSEDQDPFCAFTGLASFTRHGESSSAALMQNVNAVSDSMKKSSIDFSSPMTVEECKRNGLLRWRNTFYSDSSASHLINVSAVSGNSSFPPNGTASGKSNDILPQYTEKPFILKKFREEDLSNSCTVKRISDSRSLSNSQLVKIPRKVCIPSIKECSNSFLERLQHLDSVQLEKQKKFQITLLDIQKCFHCCHLPFFLACGTALGAHRENHFICHDDDIDLGIMFTNLVALGETINQEKSKAFGKKEKRKCCGETDESASLYHSSQLVATTSAELHKKRERYASDGLLALLSSLSSSVPHLVVFDVLGTVGKGLEIRLLHTITNVRSDINVYYEPIPVVDEKLVECNGPFVWAASYYEQSSKRAHGMYRYLHRPFGSKMVKKVFCGFDHRNSINSDDLFDVPPISYLEEYFGENWKVPKIFSYCQGLQGEYKNIIDE